MEGRREGGSEAPGDAWSPAGRRAEDAAPEGGRVGGGGVRRLIAAARRQPVLHSAALLLLVALSSRGSDAACPAGSYHATAGGPCVLCPPGYASQASSVSSAGSCTQVMGGEPFSTAGAPVNFAQWQKLEVAVGDTLWVGLRAKLQGSLAPLQAGVSRPVVTANEGWGLPEFAKLCGIEGTQEADFVGLCTGGTAPNTEAVLEFSPRPEQAGEVYSTCIKGTVAVQASWVAQPMAVCVEITVRGVGAMFTNASNVADYQTPPESQAYTTAVGCSLAIPLEISSQCKALACTISPASATAADCSAECGSSVAIGPQPAPDSMLPEGLMLTRRPADDAGQPQTDASRPQFWLLEWHPSLGTASLVPYSICLVPGPGGVQRCFAVTVEKCRHCVGSGDTLDSVANLHNADWLQLYLANPSLPSHNPHVVAPDYSVRLGVSHRVRKGEYLEQLADKFLVPTGALLDENRELWAPAALQFFPNSPSASTQIRATFFASRRLEQGEGIRLLLPQLGGGSWKGAASLSCEQVALSTVYGEFSQEGVVGCDELAAPGQACGPGRWGACKYDSLGKIMCEVNECATYGQHPLLSQAEWNADTHMLTVHVREGASIANGQEVSFVISRSAGILYPPTGMAEAYVRAVFPVPTTIDVDGLRPFELCVILPVCDTKLQCIFGADCSLVDMAQ